MLAPLNGRPLPHVGRGLLPCNISCTITRSSSIACGRRAFQPSRLPTASRPRLPRRRCPEDGVVRRQMQLQGQDLSEHGLPPVNHAWGRERTERGRGGNLGHFGAARRGGGASALRPHNGLASRPSELSLPAISLVARPSPRTSAQRTGYRLGRIQAGAALRWTPSGELKTFGIQAGFMGLAESRWPIGINTCLGGITRARRQSPWSQAGFHTWLGGKQI